MPVNLDDFTSFARIDAQDMLSEIDGLPGQLLAAWELGKTLPLPAWGGIERVLIAGMGSMAVGADLLTAYVSPSCPIPILVSRGYDLPAWARGPGTLVIALSHSGETEETLSAFDQAVAYDCRILAICTGGELAAAASESGVMVWQFDHQGQPPSALGYSFGLLLAVFSRLGLIPDPSPELDAAVAAMKAQQTSLRADVPVMMNPAKRLAGQCVGRWVVVIGAYFLEPVARRWKNQINLTAKAWAQFEFLPEVDHNTLAGAAFPENVITNTFVLFLQGSANHLRNQLRVQMTKETMMLEGVGTDFVFTVGDTPLVQMWTLLHFGDYFAYYLAMLYGIDPTPVDLIDGLKESLKNR
jgi:glucose/mannose-6-phosphate isomerase